jgi:predicted amidophosphoribosyltransferase
MIIELEGNWTKGWAMSRHTKPSVSGNGYDYTKVGKWVNRLKYHGENSYIEKIASHMSNVLSQDITPHFDIIIPVPHSIERKEQPVVKLAQKIANNINKPMSSTLLRKTKKTDAIKNLNTSEKVTQLRGAFTINESYAGKSILVVDDLYASGSTLKEITNTLFQEGKVSKVYVITATRTGWHK